MLKKILNIIKVTVILWVCILLPLIIGFSYIKSSSESDVRKYMDAYVDSESTCLAKYIGLQLKNTSKELLEISDILALDKKSSSPNLERTLKKIRKDNKNIVTICAYNKKGSSIFKQDKETPDMIDTAEFSISDLKDKDVTFKLKQLEDGSIAVEYILFREKLEGYGDCYLGVTMKWSQYENFLDKLQAGAFSRKFYIISPDCKRYISLNSLPHGAESNRNLLALGLHLADKIKSIQLGSSDVELEGLSYRVFKSEIKIPEKMDGNQLFILGVTDEEAFATLVKGIFSSLPTVITVLLCIWLCISLLLSKFFNQAKEQLSISNAISNSTPSAIIVFDAETGKIQKINPSGLTLMRLSEDKVPEANAWNIFTSPKDKDYISNAMKSNIRVMNYEVLAQSYAGNTFWTVCSASPLIMDLGMDQKVYVVLSILDINKRKEIEKKLANNAELLEKQVAERTADLESKAKELEESNKKLDQAKIQSEAANTAKTKFLNNVSTEFKTPINAIIGYSEILQEEALDRKDNVTADDLAKIIGSAKHLLSLINQILDLSSIESGKTQLFFENIKLSSLIKEVEGVSMPLITRNENSFFCEYSKEIGDMYIDQTKLRQCLLNLIDNASKFTEFGKITLKVTPIVKGGEDFVEFDVIDTGKGIASDKIENIFGSFQDNSASGTGTGLGLSITKKYIECMGGTVTVESEEGIGSKFIIKVPRICKAESNEFVEVKNQKDEEIIEDFVIETEEALEKAEEEDMNNGIISEEKQNGEKTTE